MPKLSVDYSKNINYKLCCLDQSITDIYVGQTTDFTTRKSKHKHDCNNEKKRHFNCCVYKFIREHGGWDNWAMIQIEEYPCKNKREAEARETYLMKELKSTLNSHKSFTTEKEKKQYSQEYAKTDKRKNKIREYKKTNKHKEYLNSNQFKTMHKEYMIKYCKTDKYKETRKQMYQKKILYLNELKCYNI